MGTVETPWDTEYKKQGIPSSIRAEPSGVLVWALTCWPFIAETPQPKTALDVGCGAGRNLHYMASRGIKPIGVDASIEAVTRAKERINQAALDIRPEVLHHDLANGLPLADASTDFVADIFVYKHQLSASCRNAYRREIARVLTPGGVVLLSLALRDDGYYKDCPAIADPEGLNPRTIIDPIAGIGSVLFSLDEIVAEFSDCFRLEMTWDKARRGMMHGREYVRRTLGSLWIRQ